MASWAENLVALASPIRQGCWQTARRFIGNTRRCGAGRYDVDAADPCLAGWSPRPVDLAPRTFFGTFGRSWDM
jgi:hypothetical protein